MCLGGKADGSGDKSVGNERSVRSASVYSPSDSATPTQCPLRHETSQAQDRTADQWARRTMQTVHGFSESSRGE